MKISRIIKFMREACGMSQEEFASKVGVERLAVTRWENEKVLPNKLAQMRLYEVAKEMDIDVIEFITKSLPPYRNNNGVLTLYHGSKSGIDGDIRPISRNKCDFGAGFYMGTDVHQPLTLVCTQVEPALYVVDFDTRGLKIVEIPTDIDWAMTVAFYRGRLENIKGTALYNKYSSMLLGTDVVVGSIADDRMYFVLDRFFDSAISDKGLVESLSALQLGTQYVALSEKACKQIKLVEKHTLSELEKLCLNQLSEQNRQYGIDTANEICKTYRRDGKFFDEILSEAE